MQTRRFALFVCILALCCSVAPLHAAAQELEEGDERRYSKYYNGSFVDVSARVAYEHVTSAPYAGWSWDVGLRQAFVMHLLDTRLAIREEHFAPRSEPDESFVIRAVDLSTGFHPLYLALLLSDWFGYLAASFYVEAGLGAQLATAKGDPRLDPGFRWHVGSGFDVPLTDPDRGWSIWLNALYRFTWSDFDFDAGGEVNLYHHSAFGGLSLRFNGLLF